MNSLDFSDGSESAAPRPQRPETPGPAPGARPGRAALGAAGLPAAAVLPAVVSLLLFVFLLLGPPAAQAQQLRGRLLAAGTGDPVPGALVTLRDSAGSRAASAFSGPQGGFELRAGGPGRYRVRVERIGYRTWASAPVELGRGESATRTFRVPVQPVDLRTLEVRGERRCGTPAEQGRVVARVWEEARKALEATRVSDRLGRYEFTVRSYRRRLDREGRRVIEERDSTYTARTTQPFMSPPAGELAEAGYVRGDRAGRRTFYAPDAGTLLSDAFFETHCFRVRERGGGRLGLKFEPAPGRDVPEIRGTLWVDAETSELRRLDFRYVNLGAEYSTRRLRGRLAFERLPSGAWVVRRWWIRTPRLGRERAWWNARESAALRVTGLRETGRTVTRIREPGGEVLYDLERASLAGVVRDSTRGRPLAGAAVRVAGTGHADTAGADGRYRITGLPPGRFRVRFAHPRLDSLGIQRLPPREVALERGGVSELVLAVPSWTRLLAARCPGEGAVVVGRVADAASGVSLSGARVRAVRAGPDSAAVASDRADGRGHYRLCGLSPGDEVAVRASYLGGRVRGGRRVALSGPGPRRVDLELSAGGRSVVLGRVVEAGTGEPVSGATVRLGPDARAATGADGRFRVAGVPPGRRAVTVQHLGYGARTDTVVLAGGDTIRMTARLAPEAVELAPLRVTVRGREGTEAVRGLLGVSEKSARVYTMGRREIEEADAGSAASLIRRLDAPGLSVRPYWGYRSGGGVRDGMKGSGVQERFTCVEMGRARGREQKCAMVEVRVDGVKVADPELFLRHLPPERIERIELIPPVEAGAVYGSSARNGVLLIYTRTGEGPEGEESGGSESSPGTTTGSPAVRRSPTAADGSPASRCRCCRRPGTSCGSTPRTAFARRSSGR